MANSNSDLQALYDRVIRLARSYGLDPQWELVRGTDRTATTQRQPWQIRSEQLMLFNLGYTRRSAHEALTTIATVFDYLMTTDDWREDDSDSEDG